MFTAGYLSVIILLLIFFIVAYIGRRKIKSRIKQLRLDDRASADEYFFLHCLKWLLVIIMAALIVWGAIETMEFFDLGINVAEDLKQHSPTINERSMDVTPTEDVPVVKPKMELGESRKKIREELEDFERVLVPDDEREE